MWRQKGLGAGHPDAQIERLHPAPFSFTDVSRLIRFFTKSGQTVLDPFVGIGSTLKAACLEGRHGIGIELSDEFADLARERLSREIKESLFEQPEQTVITGDAREVLPTLESESVDFVVTSPPYWNILHKADHKVEQERIAEGLSTRYSDDDNRDLGNIADYDVFLKELIGVFAECRRDPQATEAPRRHRRRLPKQGPLPHVPCGPGERPRGVGYVLKGITILYQSHKRLFPYGYPAAYVPNMHHQYIVILRKEET